MARDNKVSMPQGMGGLMRYFDEYKSRFQLQPGHVIILIVLVIIIEILLHLYGNRMLGL